MTLGNSDMSFSKRSGVRGIGYVTHLKFSGEHSQYVFPKNLKGKEVYREDPYFLPEDYKKKLSGVIDYCNFTPLPFHKAKIEFHVLLKNESFKDRNGDTTTTIEKIKEFFSERKIFVDIGFDFFESDLKECEFYRSLGHWKSPVKGEIIGEDLMGKSRNIEVIKCEKDLLQNLTKDLSNYVDFSSKGSNYLMLIFRLDPTITKKDDVKVFVAYSGIKRETYSFREINSKGSHLL